MKKKESFLSRLFGRKPKSGAVSDLEAIMALAAEPDPELAPDEEFRIFKDRDTGEFYSKVVKKNGAAAPTETQSPYPATRSREFNETDSLVVSNEGNEHTLTVCHRAVEPEDDDVLESTCGTGKVHIHPIVIFHQLLKTPGLFLGEMDAEQQAAIENSPCLPVQFMDDSREYYDITVAGQSVSIPGKYLGLKFRLLIWNGQLHVLTEHLVDDNTDELPIVVTALETSFVAETSAIHDEDDDMWLPRDKT